MIVGAAGLSAGSYLVGSAEAVAVVAALGLGAWRLRGRLFTDWSGPPARLVEALLALLALLGTAEVLGAFDALQEAPLVGASMTVGAAMTVLGRRPRGTGSTSVPSGRGEVVAAGIALAVVTAQWVSHTVRAFNRGMTQPDTLTYHGPFTARFLQHGTFGSLAGVGVKPQRFFPQNSELVHAVAAVPFHRDLLSPLVNLGWAALVVLAAWCIGRRRGVAALCTLGAAAWLALPTLAGSQPGQMSTDVVASGLLLAAVALLLEAGFTPTSVGLAGAAAGLALGTKVTTAAPIMVLTVGVIVLALRARRPWGAAAWCSGLVLSGSYWFIRNWIVTGSPVPWLNITIGPISLRATAAETGTTAVHYLTDGTVWRRYYLPGLGHAFGPAWPVVVVVALGTALLALLRGLGALERLTGLAALVGMIVYPFIPLTGDGGGSVFQFNLRYVTPVLLLAFVLGCLALAGARRTTRFGVAVAVVAFVALDATTREIERMPAWPSDGALVGAVAGLIVLLVVASGRGLLTSLLRPAARSVAVATTIALACFVAGGWFVQGRYFERRYVQAGLPGDTIQTPFHGVQHASVAVFGTDEVYPMFGVDLSNHVTKPTGPTNGTPLELCQRWKQLLSERYRYVVIGHLYIFVFTPPPIWFTTDPATVTIVKHGNSAVFRLDRALDPGRCPSQL